MKKLRITALMGVPLIVRGAVFGLVLVNCFGGTARFTGQDLDFLQKAAATLALALENARLYETEHRIADRLQEALLTMPDDVPGVAFAHAYHSATDSARVGGDFYDLFELDEDRVGVMIGDVAGKGLDAAVLTSLVKNTIRAHANEKGKMPAHILELTNDVVFKATPTESFVTVFLGILDRRDGSLAYSNAGHTTAAVLCDDGSVSRLEGTGPLLGAFSGVAFGESTACLGEGDLLFLYTDGLTEARSDGEQYGEERLFGFLNTARSGRPSDVVGDVMADVIAFTQCRLRDDLAILAIERTERSAALA